MSLPNIENADNNTSNSSDEAVFLGRLAESYLNNDSPEKCANLVRDFYKNNRRHRYSAVSEYLFRAEGGDDVDYCIKACEDLMGNFPMDKLDGAGREQCIQKLHKLVDHMKLERLRFKQLDQHKTNIDELSRSVSEERKRVETLKNEAAQLKNETISMEKKLDDQKFGIVGVIGIFAGIIMAFSGTFTLIGNAVANLNTFNVYNISFTTILLGLVLTDVVVTLFYCIFKILGREVKITFFIFIVIMNVVLIALLLFLPQIFIWRGGF